MSAASQTSIVFTLPLELRQLIYSYVYNEDVNPDLDIRHDDQIWKGRANWGGPGEALGLLVACRALYHEVLPFVYAPHWFVIIINGFEGDCGHGYYAGPLDCTNKLLRSIHMLRIVMDTHVDREVDVILRRLRLLAAALAEDGEGGAALLKTCEVIPIGARRPVPRQFVESRIEEALKQLDEKGESGGGVEMFRRILMEAEIVTYPCPVAKGKCNEQSCKCWQ